MQHTVKNIATHGIALAVAIVLRFLLELFSVYAYGTSQDGALMLLLTVMLYGAALASVKMYLNESPQVT
jgi:predicted membrane channel-forming protein YqfA (hemolysin III family)